MSMCEGVRDGQVSVTVHRPAESTGFSPTAHSFLCPVRMRLQARSGCLTQVLGSKLWS